jgi:hypothetical protein
VANAEMKINLTVDDDLRQFLIDSRAAKLAEVDAIEKLLGIDRTKDLRRVVKDLKHHETLAGYVVKDT